MLTPRRTLLLLAGFLLFGVAYFVYAHLLGWLDGLPQLPAKMLERDAVVLLPPENQDSPTQKKLALAFGERSPETDYALYETQLDFPSGGGGSVVLAAGPVPGNPNSKRVPLTPFSLAVFSKPKPAHLRLPGEVTEITTIHSDKAILEFDRVIQNANDMRAAKLVRLELVSDFEQTFEDPRRGMIHVTNNQRSADPNRFLVIRTPGPMFYRDAKAAIGTPAAQGPDLWTDAPVEIVDRQNLPRSIGSATPATAVSKSEDARNPATVADVLTGRRSPPPTVTAIGLRVYLEPQPAPGQPKSKQANGGVNGVRRFEFLEQVLVNLWVDNGQTLVGGTPAPDTSDAQRTNALALTPPPAAIAAITGGLGPAAYTARLLDRALLQIETRGPFAYDSEKSTARFDVVPHSDPNLPNDVQVTKVSNRDGTSRLFSQVLELELNGGPTTAARPANSPAVKKIHAWTYTAGRYLTAASQDETMQAYGQDLVHDHAASRTVLTGSPLYVVREKNVLSAGSPQRSATMTIEPDNTPAKKPRLMVRGPGSAQLFDSASNATTLTATWQTSLVQSKELIGGVEQDLFVFTDAAKFEDVKADYWLKGNVLKLWLEPRGNPPDGKAATVAGGRPQPAHVQALGKVTAHSSEYDIEETDQLNVFFADPKRAHVAVAPIPPPAPPMGPPAPGTAPPLPPPANRLLPAVAAGDPKLPEQPKPPLKIRAKDIQTWVTRVPVPVPPPPPKSGDNAVSTKPPEPGKPVEQPATTVKYQLDRARCEDSVIIHQDPTDPTKPRGIDILGRLLLLDSSPDGSIMTVYGWPNRPGEVHQEDMSLIGPEIKLDQIHNAAFVKGRGALTMPTNSDLAGSDLKQPEVVVIHWRDRMDFNGTKRSAEFEGKVSARQGESWVLCHTMHVIFDRPVYFNQAQKKAAPKGPNGEKAKLHTVFCYPAAGDAADDRQELWVTFNQVEFDKAGKMIKWQRLRAQELKMEAAVQDPGGEPYQRVTALGPGELRVWQPGDKELAGPAPNANNPPPKAPSQPGAKPPPKDAEQEMKLTIVNFSNRMTAIDKGKVFQKATFADNVYVISVPAESPDLDVQRHKLPPRSVLLTCKKELVVWSHKKGDTPVTQRMDASGAAYLRSDDYEGWGETISNDGKLVILNGNEAVPARIMNRFNKGTDQSGETIIYDRTNGSFKVNKSFGGTLGPPPKK